ncbi:hypothetical protein [Pseudomonas sp. IT-P294]|uniref:hypothetical protein n=1 Tax=Pseudomonas sp. IT-P294 TaxID=3026454 RepID=UPI0039E08E75
MLLLERALEDSSSFWAIEYAIGKKYFEVCSNQRSSSTEQQWLRLQIWKEWYGSGVYGGPGTTVTGMIGEAASQLVPLNPLHDYELLRENFSYLTFAQEELSHYMGLLDIYISKFGSGFRDKLEDWGEVPAGRNLTKRREALRHQELGEVVIRLSEGGGLGLFYGMKRALTGRTLSAFDSKLLKIVQRILNDEEVHLSDNIKFAKYNLTTEEEYNYVSETLAEISSQKLKEREEQFNISRDSIAKGYLATATQEYLADYYFPLINIAKG